MCDDILEKIRSKDGKIYDPITEEEIPEDLVYILSSESENISYTSIETLYKSFIIDGKAENPFTREPLTDIEKIEKYGREKRIVVRSFKEFFSLSYNLRDEVRLFEWFAPLSNVFRDILYTEKINNYIVNVNGKIVDNLDKQISEFAINGIVNIVIALKEGEYFSSESEESESEENLLHLDMQEFTQTVSALRNQLPPVVNDNGERNVDAMSGMLRNLLMRAAENASSIDVQNILINPSNNFMTDIASALLIPQQEEIIDEFADLD